MQDATPVEICWVPQTPEPISAVSQPKFAITRPRGTREHVAEILPFNGFFSIIDTYLSYEDSQPDKAVWWSADGDFYGRTA